MSSGSGGKPPSGSQPGRLPAETPQRLVVRSLDGTTGDSLAGSDTAVAIAADKHKRTSAEHMDTPYSGLANDIVGTTLSGRYLVTRKVGQGGMGAVFEATHTIIGKRVAVKVLLEKYAQREAIVARLKQEAQLASSIGHEHIIDITDFGTTDDGRTFVVMEFLEGESLAECLARETKLSEQRILRIIQQGASALHAAHAKGIVHRDIKPENLFLLRRKDQDFVKVVDFGISKSLRVSDEQEEQPRLTQTGMVLGTPLYMSPEQARGDDQCDHRVDIYALGVIMYEAATGGVPFAGNNYLSVISQVLNEDPKSPRTLRPELSEEFEAVVMRAMAKDRKERYGSAAELLNDINALLEDPTRSTERAKITGPRKKPVASDKKSTLKIAVWIGAIALTVIAVVVLVKFMMGTKPQQAAAAPSDAGVVAVLPDAALPVVEPPIDATAVELIEVSIKTDPTGATVLKDGVALEGVTPMTAQIVKKEKDVEFVLQLAGHSDHVFKLNPLEEKRRTFKFTLKRLPKGTPPRPPVPRGSAAPSAGSAGPRLPDGLTRPSFGGSNVPLPKSR